MYLRAIHADASIPALRKLILENPLGIFTTAISPSSFPIIQITHIPFVLDIQDRSSETELGVLRGHLARANPHSKAIIESLESNSTNELEQEVMVLFNYPVNHYVTPKFYTETKPETGKVVPTWNYAAAQVYGKAKVFHDAKDDETVGFLSKQVSDLSRYAEQNVMGYTGNDGKPGAWKVSDAPDRYVEILRKSIIGIQIRIDRLEGKFKMSQEMGEGDRNGVVEGFRASDTLNGDKMADIVEERGELENNGKTTKALGDQQ